MVQISKAEAAFIRKKVPAAKIRKTRYHYYMEEGRMSNYILSNIRLYGINGYVSRQKQDGGR